MKKYIYIYHNTFLYRYRMLELCVFETRNILVYQTNDLIQQQHQQQQQQQQQQDTTIANCSISYCISLIHNFVKQPKYRSKYFYTRTFHTFIKDLQLNNLKYLDNKKGYFNYPV